MYAGGYTNIEFGFDLSWKAFRYNITAFYLNSRIVRLYYKNIVEISAKAVEFKSQQEIFIYNTRITKVSTMKHTNNFRN